MSQGSRVGTMLKVHFLINQSLELDMTQGIWNALNIYSDASHFTEPSRNLSYLRKRHPKDLNMAYVILHNICKTESIQVPASFHRPAILC